MDEFKCPKCNYTFYDIEIEECPHCGFPIQLFIDREMILDVQGTLVGVRAALHEIVEESKTSNWYRWEDIMPILGQFLYYASMLGNAEEFIEYYADENDPAIENLAYLYEELDTITDYTAQFSDMNIRRILAEYYGYCDELMVEYLRQGEVEKARQNLEFIHLKFERTIAKYDEMIGIIMDLSNEIMKYMTQAIDKY